MVVAQTVQLDLFGEVEQGIRDAEARVRRRAEWKAGFERADWIAPYDTADGKPAGTVYKGYRCPDPACGKIEPSGFILALNHGFDPDIPDHQPLDGRCRLMRATTIAPALTTNGVNHE